MWKGNLRLIRQGNLCFHAFYSLPRMHCRKPPQVPSPSAPWIENIQDPGGELQHLLPLGMC